jgi:hypothetical protein
MKKFAQPLVAFCLLMVMVSVPMLDLASAEKEVKTPSQEMVAGGKRANKKGDSKEATGGSSGKTNGS